MELLVPTISDVIFKYTWPIPRYKKSISKKSLIDSSSFQTNVNGIHSSWNLSIRFWKDPDGKRIINPVVLCLNMLSCNIDEAEQAKIRFQFGIFNAELKHWEYCHVNRTILELKSCTDIISLGYKDLSIVDRHIKKNGEVLLMVKIQIIQCENEKHNLSQDMARLLKRPFGADTKLLCGGLNSTEIPVHSNIIAARSSVLADMISPLAGSQMKETLKVNTEEKVLDMQGMEEEKDHYMFVLELLDLSTEVTEELLRYIYTDHVDNLDNLAPQLLSLAERFYLQGLKELCERNLIETINPENIASRLLVADEFHCGALKRASLTYCEENVTVLNKSLAWKMMEHVNPELFNEVCEAGIGSSRSSNMDDSELSN
ncbi:TD and POZ domain-containing protein 2 [Nomia melanderi]|uniref:TD and POZ domain-containing protein 2 n=1 Tax=Nomia melanderi TaxID=2448451 RepID=UPI00130456FA|nr:protein roadkill-like isoform X2 [Nomia melanderi]XP_031841508.1 protein roadkill-like isoform X2 [Nomia melanderi]XP_031841509.1 protein roadkill-like isoform X2 [Nomia melanderi]XP_031841511.1 protein roadkill-like isoform X2 [Nomia melanderi]XP_031841512.1 protein roadkill-like isoform X2 [Nomia melanderi]XP_031841513.1 protein roadkill-like isoform X2 [Nomia melanderi]XP_031841514.1 protein roadkill-like isoform X2 [Nomia melanderi]XP_031841515.1 protein roadkill-like isoform X2 [Nomi